MVVVFMLYKMKMEFRRNTTALLKHHNVSGELQDEIDLRVWEGVALRQVCGLC